MADAPLPPTLDWAHLPEHLGLAITDAPVPFALPAHPRPESWIQVDDASALVRFPGGARLLVHDGAEASLDLTDMTDTDGDPSWMLQGWAITLAWLQRGRLSLHAAIMDTDSGTLGIAGERGAGKSTTSMGLRERGHRLLVDDVGLVDIDGNRVWITPFARNVHLLPDAAEALGLDFEALPPLAGGRTKAAFRAEDPSSDPRQLNHIVVLTPTVGCAEPMLRLARGAERVEALIPHTTREGLAPRILGPERYFELLTQLAGRVPVHILERPAESWTHQAVLDLIEDLA